MSKDSIPQTITGFKEYIEIAYKKASVNLSVYGIPPEKFAVITVLYNDYIAKYELAANPDTATKGNREAQADGVRYKATHRLPRPKNQHTFYIITFF